MSAWKRQFGDFVRAGGLAQIRSARELKVLMVYVEHANKDGRAWPSRATVAGLAGIGGSPAVADKEVIKLTSALAERGLIERIPGGRQDEIRVLPGGTPATAGGTGATKRWDVSHQTVAHLPPNGGTGATALKEEHPIEHPIEHLIERASESGPTFDEFWRAYPRTPSMPLGGRTPAGRAWDLLPLSDRREAMRAVAALTEQVRAGQRFVPTPSNFLRPDREDRTCRVFERYLPDEDGGTVIAPSDGPVDLQAWAEGRA